MTELAPFETREQIWKSKICSDLTNPFTKRFFEDGVLGEDALIERLQREETHDDE